MSLSQSSILSTAFLSFFLLGPGCMTAGEDAEAGSGNKPSLLEESEELEAEEEVEIEFDAERILLHEVYSGANCGPCKEADELIHDVLNNNPDEYSVIHYQVGSDPYMSYESVARYCYYINGTPSCGYAIPYMHVDGVNGFHPVQVNDDQGYLQADFDRYQSEPCHMRIEVSHTVTDKTVDIDVTITAGGDYPSDQMVLQAAILENKTLNNTGINGQTEFHYVMKKMVPNHLGTNIPAMVAGETQTVSLSYTFNGEYNGETTRNNMVSHGTEHTVEGFDDLSVVVFVQDNADQMVHQSGWSH
jgi:hypothetical protein